MEQKACIVGLDIGGTNIRIGAVDLNGNVRAFQKVNQQEVFSGVEILPAITDFIKSFISKNDLSGEVTAISIGFPSTINKERTKILQTPNIEGMDNLDAVDYIEKKLKIKVLIEKDVCTALYYDIKKYCIPKCDILIGCYIGTGIGNIICIDGKPVIGKDGVACELGHVPVAYSDEACGCGNYGCLENIAAGKYLVKLCNEIYKDTSIEDIFVKHKDDLLIKKFVDCVAIAAATEINILNPDYIILGGGVLNMKEFPIKELEKSIHIHTRKPYPEQGIQIIFAEDDEQKGIVGAALYAMEVCNMK